MLRIAVFVERVFRNNLFTEMTTTTLGEDGVFCMELEARFERRLVLAISSHAHVAGCNPFHTAVFIVEDFGSSEAGKHFSAKLHCLLAQPCAQIAKRDDVITFVMHGLRHQQIGEFYRRCRAWEIIHIISCHRRVQWRTTLLPIWEQLVQSRRLEHGTRQDVCTDFGAFFEDTYRYLFTFGLCELQQPTGRREPRRARADDDDIDFH